MKSTIKTIALGTVVCVLACADFFAVFIALFNKDHTGILSILCLLFIVMTIAPIMYSMNELDKIIAAPE